MGEAVLVFPAGSPDALAYRDRAKAMGLRVIGASSVDHDPAQGGYDAWEHLPAVGDPDFDRSLADILIRHEVTAVHTPLHAIWKHLAERLGELSPGASLSGSQRDGDDHYQALRQRVANARRPVFWAAFPPQPPLSDVERAGLLRLAQTVPGACGEEKMHALMEVMRHAPPGDIVEIGSACGRSASLLLPLSQRYGLGKVLCIDPWDAADSPDGEDGEETLRMFEINLAPFAQGRLNFVRARSDHFAPDYGPGLTVESEVFGATAYEGRIAVLHLDGGAAQRQAQRDCDDWTPHLVGGGWIIFGGYEGSFGDGPKVVADAFAATNERRIAARFQAGDALFLQLKRGA